MAIKMAFHVIRCGQGNDFYIKKNNTLYANKRPMDCIALSFSMINDSH